MSELFDTCELVIDKQRTIESRIGFDLFFPKLEGSERYYASQVSKSEALFLDYALTIFM